MNTRIKAIAYDLDGVVVNSLGNHYLAIQAVLSRCGISTPPIEKMNEWWYGPYEDRLIEMGVNLSLEETRQIYNQTLIGKVFPLFPKFSQVACRLNAQQILLFIVTATFQLENVTKILSDNKILDQFTDIRYGHDDKKIFLRELLETHDLYPDQMIFVGDTKRDMLNGVLAGVLPVGFDGGFGGIKSLIEAGAKHIITNHEQIFSLLESY